MPWITVDGKKIFVPEEQLHKVSFPNAKIVIGRGGGDLQPVEDTLERRLLRTKGRGITKKELMEFEIAKRKMGEEKTDEAILRLRQKHKQDIKDEIKKGTFDPTRSTMEESKIQFDKQHEENRVLWKLEQMNVINKDPELKKEFISLPRAFSERQLKANR